MFRRTQARMMEALKDLDGAFETLNFAEHPLFKNPALAPYFNDWVQHSDDDSYWKSVNIRERHSNVDVPAYNMSGWYDIFLGGAIRNFVG